MLIWVCSFRFMIFLYGYEYHLVNFKPKKWKGYPIGFSALEKIVWQDGFTLLFYLFIYLFFYHWPPVIPTSKTYDHALVKHLKVIFVACLKSQLSFLFPNLQAWQIYYIYFSIDMTFSFHLVLYPSLSPLLCSFTETYRGWYGKG